MTPLDPACEVLVVGGGPAACHRGPAARLVGPARARGGPPGRRRRARAARGAHADVREVLRSDGDPLGDRRRGVRAQPRAHRVVGGVRAARGAVRRRPARVAGHLGPPRPADARGRGRRRVPGRTPVGHRRRGAGVAGDVPPRRHRPRRPARQTSRPAPLRAGTPHRGSGGTMALARRMAARRSDPHTARVLCRRLGLVGAAGCRGRAPSP